MAAKAVADATRLLQLNAGAQILASSVMGTLMLLPLQPWFPWKAPGKMFKEFGAAHLDWFMLGFMQHVAASILSQQVSLGHPEAAAEVSAISKLLVFGGWMNPTAYIFRGLGIDAFVLGGSKKQFMAALLGAVSSSAIILAWTRLFRIVYLSDRVN